MEILIAAGIFALVFGVLYFTLASRVPVVEEAIQRRLENIAAQPKTAARLRLYDAKEETFWENVANFFLGDKREIPAAYSKIGRLLHQAAYRGERAIRIFWGLRIFLGLAFSFGGLFLAFLSKASTQDVLLLGGVGGFTGYMLPYFTVRRKAKARVLEMRETLPDTLDLIVVCVEAGMGVDAALNRVGKEQSAQGLAMGEELLLATQELQAGAVRKEALARCADRIGIEEFRGLITFLTQTEELGGSIARSLRVYASTMREKRSQAAEEAARKAVIKLIFPLVFFILPAIFILLLGPAGLSIMRTLSSPLEGIEMPVTNLTKKTWLATKVRKADSFITRLVGLLKRTNLGPEEALWLTPSKGVHTVGMKFPIDVVFLDKDNVVLGIISGLVPYRVTGVRLKGHSVLELPKGTLKKSRTEVGDQLEISLVESSEMDDLRDTRLSQIG